MKKIFVLTATACLLAGTASLAQMAPMTAGPSNTTPMRGIDYVAKAGAGDLYEIQSSRLALGQAESPKVKTFARTMIKHHTMTTKDVVAGAKAAGISPPPPMLEPDQADMIGQLKPLSGAAFDRAYVAQQKTAHKMALALHQTYATQGDTPQLRKAATTAVPIVKQHIDMLGRL